MRARRQLTRSADRDDNPSPVAVNTHGSIPNVAECVRDARQHQLAVESGAVHFALCRIEAREVQVEPAGTPITHLHRGEMTPGAMLDHGPCVAVGWLAIDLHPQLS
jgi:hypothetical protein